jgi:hypothetical protein
MSSHRCNNDHFSFDLSSNFLAAFDSGWDFGWNCNASDIAAFGSLFSFGSYKHNNAPFYFLLRAMRGPDIIANVTARSVVQTTTISNRASKTSDGIRFYCVLSYQLLIGTVSLELVPNATIKVRRTHRYFRQPWVPYTCEVIAALIEILWAV